MKVKYKSKEINIPDVITCPNDGGTMVIDIKEKAYVCINVEGCSNRIPINEYIKKNRLFEMEPHIFV